jgi:hypothetical protein
MKYILVSPIFGMTSSMLFCYLSDRIFKTTLYTTFTGSKIVIGTTVMGLLAGLTFEYYF